MKRIHGLFIALALGVAAVAGTFAALETTSLGAQAATVSEAQIAAREQKLDRAEKTLRRAAKRRPPALPAGSPSPSQALAAAPAPAPQPVSSDEDHGGDHDDDPDDWDDEDDDDDDRDEEHDGDDEHDEDDDD